MYERILVPLDGSKLAQQALPYARAWASAKSAKVELLEVIAPLEEFAKPEVDDYAAVGPGALGDPWPAPHEWSLIAEHFRNKAWLQLADSAAMLGDAVEVSSKVLVGDAAEAIITEADRQPETLIAMATHGRSGIGRWLLGSVTDKVVRHANHPTLVIRAHDDVEGTPAATIGEVILPLDGSATAETAIPHAVEMAKVLGVGISLVRAVSPMPHADAFVEYLPDGYQPTIGKALDDAEAYLESRANGIREQGVANVRAEAMLGGAGSMIVDAARGSGDALVVMATHGRSGVGRWALGSVTDRVVRHSHGPVLVVRPGPAA